MLDYIFRKYILATEAVKTRVQNHDIVMCAPRWNSIESRCVLLMMMMCLTQGRTDGIVSDVGMCVRSFSFANGRA